MEFFLEGRHTYDWLIVMADDSLAVAHGQKNWEATRRCVIGEIKDYARLQRDYRAVIIPGRLEGCWEVSHKSGLTLGRARPVSQPSRYGGSLRDYKYEYSTAAHSWSPLATLRAVGSGWHLNYVAAIAA